MALIKNREKYSGALTNIALAFPELCRKLSVLFFILLSLQLLYTRPQDSTARAGLEVSGSLASVIHTAFNVVIQSVKSIGNSFDYLKDLHQENIALRIEIARLQSAEDMATIVNAENKSLKKALHFAKMQPYNSIFARLVSINTDAYSQTALLQAGEDHGVRVGQVVLSESGVIGRIIKTSDNYSRVMLITDMGSRIPVISSHSRMQSIVSGVSEKRARLLYTPENSSIQVGESLVTSGDGKIYPAGLFVGKISRIEGGEIYVTSSSDLSKVEFVTILRPEDLDVDQ